MRFITIHLIALVLSPLSVFASVTFDDLATASTFAVLAGSTVTNTGATVVHGDLGVWEGSSITGFPPGIVTGTIHTTDAVASQAQSDLTTSYNFAAAEPCGNNLTDQDLGGLTLTPGTYCFSSSAQLTGALSLNGQGNPNALFLFQIGSTLTTASSSSIVLINSANGHSIFWQVGSSATLGTATAFTGNILALTDITLTTGANIQCGRALARNGAVTMDTNDVSIFSCETGAVPEPSTASMFLLIGVPGLLWLWRRRPVRG